MPEALTPHFTIDEFERSQTAARRGLKNRMGPSQRAAAKALCENVLEPTRALAGSPISVSSGYRAPKVNAAVGGSSSSQHMRGEAADISTNSLTTEELFQLIKGSAIKFDQLIQEFDSWIHVSYRAGRNRGQCLRATRERGRTVYREVPR